MLYRAFRTPQHAAKTIELEDDLLIHKDGQEIVRLTILNASRK